MIGESDWPMLGVILIFGLLLLAIWANERWNRQRTDDDRRRGFDVIKPPDAHERAPDQ